MIDGVSAYRPYWSTRPAAEGVVRDIRPVEKSASTARLLPVDAFDAADAEFDFQAADKAAAATLQRDQQQMKLAEMADRRPQGSVSLQTAVAAYHEWDE